MPKLPIDWELVRRRYEAGDTAYRISEDLGGRPSKPGIKKRAQREGWTQRTNTLTVARELPIVERARSLTGPSKATADRLAFILELVAKGASEKLAAQAAGINPKTLAAWKDQDPQLAEQLRQVRAGKVAEWISHIDNHAQRDWKAAKELLAASPEADQFAHSGGGGITVVLNIDRADHPQTGTIIDHK